MTKCTEARMCLLLTSTLLGDGVYSKRFNWINAIITKPYCWSALDDYKMYN